MLPLQLQNNILSLEDVSCVRMVTIEPSLSRRVWPESPPAGASQRSKWLFLWRGGRCWGGAWRQGSRQEVRRRAQAGCGWRTAFPGAGVRATAGRPEAERGPPTWGVSDRMPRGGCCLRWLLEARRHRASGRSWAAASQPAHAHATAGCGGWPAIQHARASPPGDPPRALARGRWHGPGTPAGQVWRPSSWRGRAGRAPP